MSSWRHLRFFPAAYQGVVVAVAVFLVLINMITPKSVTIFIEADVKILAPCETQTSHSFQTQAKGRRPREGGGRLKTDLGRTRSEYSRAKYHLWEQV